MITRKDLQDFAGLKGLNLGNAEKDYLIDIALLSISRRTKNELVFKGGTCLYKFYKLNRFSEDIDFSAINNMDTNKFIKKLIMDFGRFGIKAAVHKKKELFNSILITFRIEGPLYSGNPNTFASLGIDINLKSSIIIEPDVLAYNSNYPEIPMVSMSCMKEKEIFAEKIRAIMTRKKARDLFDLNFLLEKGTHAEKNLLQKKLHYYNETFDMKRLTERIKILSGQWEKELRGFTAVLPSFDSVYKNVTEKLTGLYKE